MADIPPPSAGGMQPEVGPRPRLPNHQGGLPAYAELHCVSSFSFHRGASSPQELVDRAQRLGYSALALTDDCSVAGVVRAHTFIKEELRRALATDQPLPIKFIVGSEFRVEAPDEMGGAFKLVALAKSRIGYGHLSEFITRLRREAPKGQYRLTHDMLDAGTMTDCLLLLVPPRPCTDEALARLAAWVHARYAGRLWIAVELLGEWDDALWLQRLRQVGEQAGLPLVAAGDVHFHVRSRKPLQDVMTAIRLGCTVAECGLALQPNAERHLRSRLRLAYRYPADLLQATLDIAGQCNFNLQTLGYEYPQELVPVGETPTSHLRKLTEKGLKQRYGDLVPDPVKAQVDKELDIIRVKRFEPFFLTVEDIVHFAKSQKILCQGRGSAANSTVCYALGITEVDPTQQNTLFERFISIERNEHPDIDVDFEHQRRNEVIAYIYRKYTRHRTALAATVISYRTRSAVRDVGKALGFDLDTIDALAKSHQWWEDRAALHQRMRELGLDPNSVAARQWFTLTEALVGMPRHLSQHVGGFVIAEKSLGWLVPVENTAMPDRSVIQWDKDDLESLGLLKVDVLALGMLTAIKHSLAFISQVRGGEWCIQDIPREDPATYAMIQKADTIGVFQIESRAQMSMLPRLKPSVFYDLVVQVAIVRPGPIQGGMVHPFLASRKEGASPAPYPAILGPALERTRGVPIFQEQVMQIVMIGAGFTAGQADELRRAMAAWKRKGGLEPFKERIIQGLKWSTGDLDFAHRIFEMIKGFGEYGFPESHAGSFALLAYVSAWIKCHEPAAFLAGLLNAQPMGFYAPSQLVQDARRHGVEVRPPDVMHSEVQASLEPDMDTVAPGQDGAGDKLAWPTAMHNLDSRPQPVVRLGLHLIKGLGESTTQRIVQARAERPFTDVDDLARRANLDQADLRHLASADALRSLAGHRRQQVWEASARHRAPGLLREAPVHEPPLVLPAPPEGEDILFDYTATGLTLRQHPLALLRERLLRQGLQPASHLATLEDGRLARACGIVTMRQQPATAKGTIFVTLEDETGTVNVVVWTSVRERFRAALLQSRLLAVHGVWQTRDGVSHLVARRLQDLTPLLGRLGTRSRDFH